MSLAGSGDVQVLKLQEKNFTVNIAGSGNAKAEGIAENVQTITSGSGNIDLSAVAAKNHDCSLTYETTLRNYAHCPARQTHKRHDEPGDFHNLILYCCSLVTATSAGQCENTDDQNVGEVCEYQTGRTIIEC